MFRDNPTKEGFLTFLFGNTGREVTFFMEPSKQSASKNKFTIQNLVFVTRMEVMHL